MPISLPVTRRTVAQMIGAAAMAAAVGAPATAILAAPAQPVQNVAQQDCPPGDTVDQFTLSCVPDLATGMAPPEESDVIFNNNPPHASSPSMGGGGGGGGHGR